MQKNNRNCKAAAKERESYFACSLFNISEGIQRGVDMKTIHVDTITENIKEMCIE